MKEIILIVLSFCLLTNSCLSKQRVDSSNEISSLHSLLSWILSNDSIVDISIYEQLNKSIDEEALLPIELVLMDSIDIEKKQITINVTKRRLEPSVPYFNEKFFYSICLKSDSVIVVENRFVSALEIDTIIERHFYFCNKFLNNISYEEKEIDLLGKIKRPTIVYSLTIDTTDKKVIKREEWDLCISILKEIINIYKKERTIISLRLFNKDYNMLSIEEMNALIQYRPMGVLIYFNLQCGVIYPVRADLQ